MPIYGKRLFLLIDDGDDDDAHVMNEPSTVYYFNNKHVWVWCVMYSHMYSLFLPTDILFLC